MAEPLSRIVIIGGGTAAWMAAVHLNRTLGSHRCTVTVVETPGLGTTEVAVAAMPSLVGLLAWLGIEEADFMRRCSATYKLATRFADWNNAGRHYWHSSGDGGSDRLFRSWLQLQAGDRRARALDGYSLHAVLAQGEKGPRPLDATSALIESGAYGYHVDPAAVTACLREIATAEGAVHVFGTVRNVERDERGSIAAVDIGGERRASADLYLDCTGPDGLLIGKAPGDRWLDWSGLLLCDRAIELPLPRGSELPPYTECSALAGGWMWRIALAHRTGCGYAYSSAHVEPEAAVEALLARAGLRRARSADPRLVTWKVGRRTACWVGNCVAIGASAGFLEPLEATGLHLVQRSIELLLEHLPDAGFADEQRRTYNGAMAEMLDAVRDFTILHYQLSGRPEPFWRDARAVPLPESIVELLDAYDAKGEIPAGATGVFSEASHYFVLAGSNRLPRVRLADPAAVGEAREVLSRIDGQNMVIAAAMPRHSELIAFINRPAAGVGLDGLGVPNASWR